MERLNRAPGTCESTGLIFTSLVSHIAGSWVQRKTTWWNNGENFSNLVKRHKSIESRSSTSTRINSEKIWAKCVLNYWNWKKKTVLEAARGKQYITYKGKTTSITEDFSSESQKPKPVITSPMLRKKEVLTRNSMSVKTSLLRPYKGIFRWMKMKRILCQYASAKRNANSNFFFFWWRRKIIIEGNVEVYRKEKKKENGNNWYCSLGLDSQGLLYWFVVQLALFGLSRTFMRCEVVLRSLEMSLERIMGFPSLPL